MVVVQTKEAAMGNHWSCTTSGQKSNMLRVTFNDKILSTAVRGITITDDQAIEALKASKLRSRFNAQGKNSKPTVLRLTIKPYNARMHFNRVTTATYKT